MRSERRWRAKKPPPEVYERLLDDLLGREYSELGDVERKLLAILLRWFEVELRCPCCLRWFKPGRADQKFCSSKCRIRLDSKLWHREERRKKRDQLLKGRG